MTARVHTDKASALTVGGIFTVIGIAIIAMMAFSPEGLNVPYWVGVAAASSFSFAGLSVIVQAFGLSRLGRWLGLGVLLGLATPGLWILLDPAEKQCSASVGIAGGSITSGGGDFMCRAVFGFGAVIVLALAIVFVVTLVRRHKREAPGSVESGK